MLTKTSEPALPKDIELDQDENIVIIIRRHWFVFRNSVLIAFFLPFMLLYITFWLDYFDLPSWLRNFLGNLSLYGALIAFLIGMVMFLWKLFIWKNSFYVVTDKRLIFVEQQGLFSHDDRQISLGMVQDVKAQINGIIPVMYGFGDVYVQAWTDDKPMVLRIVPKPKDIQQAIMRVALASNVTNGSSSPGNPKTQAGLSENPANSNLDQEE
jgi:hypothetical protein